MQPLLQYNPVLTQEQKDNLFMANFPLIEQAVNFQGLSLLASIVPAVTFGFNAVGWTPVSAYSGSFSSSGSLVIILGSFFGGSYAGADCLLQLLVDGNPVAVSAFPAGTDHSVQGNFPAFYAAQMPAGTHTVGVSVRAQNSEGTNSVLGSTTISSGYFVIEARQG